MSFGVMYPVALFRPEKAAAKPVDGAGNETERP